METRIMVYSKVPLLRPLNSKTSLLLRPHISGPKLLISMWLGRVIKTNSLLRSLFCQPSFWFHFGKLYHN